MFVRVRVQLDQADDAVVVPLTAVIEHAGETGVFAVDRGAGTARFVPVTLGIVEGERAQIRTPGLDGEVVTLGQHLLEDGAEVILPNGATTAAAPPAPESATP
jgi:multidrug efflux pump subunit AcrA (membrane-fusion protein)